ncbi:MAG: arginine--tRNA ligase [Candidatus Pacearchaeota archaeon]
MKRLISEIIQKALEELNVKLKKEEIENFIEIPPSTEMGDYAFPCFFLAEKLKQNPNEIALEIREKIGSSKITKTFQDIQTNGGYINFFLDRKLLAINIINQILKEKENFGKTNLGEGKKALIEHTSINPNASPHVGRARNAMIGDSLVKILSFLGFNPEVHYYVNDVSKQIAMLVFAGAENLKFEGMLKKYISISAKIKKSPKLEKKIFELLYKFEHGDKDVVKKFNKITSTCVKGQVKILSELGIHYNIFDYESEYLGDSKAKLSELEKTKKLFKDEDGRFVLDQRGTSIDGQMKTAVLVLTRSDGTGLYPLRDISYTIEKMKIAEKNIIVLGEDQKLYFQQIKEALKLLKYNSPEVVHYSFILLNEKGKSKKMSTRKGDVVLLEDFLEDAIKKAKKEMAKRKTKGDAKKVGIGAVKYSILKNNNNKIINFNLDEALNFEGDTGPYLLYSYARASSIIKKAKKYKKDFSFNEIESKEIDLVKKLSQFPDVVLKSYQSLNPSPIANYSYQLSQIFNEFYHECPVIGNEKEFFRLNIVESFRIVLKNSLALLGIETIERM